jgi:transcriptional regulator with XRE-family HTH domain
MELKEKLVRIRATLNLSQEQLARALNVAFVTLNRWENGHTKPSKKTMMQIDDFCKAKGIAFWEAK